MQNQPKNRESQWTILKLLKWTTAYFKSHNIENPRASSEILLAHALNLRRIDLYLRYDQPLVRRELDQFKATIKKRIKKEPVAYIVGRKEFWSMDMALNRNVLIPRPETECLVEAVLDEFPQESISGPRRILELGTGSGAIILALASQRAKDIFFASDRFYQILELAKQNAKRHHLDGRIQFFCGSWLSPVSADGPPFDIIVSNPPYIKTGQIDKLQPEIHLYEPRLALDGGADGLFCLRQIIETAHLFLSGNGSLFLEIGYDQKDEVQKIADTCGRYKFVAFTKDYGGNDRVVQIRKCR